MHIIVKNFLGIILTPLFLLAYNLNNNGEDCGPTYEATDRGIIALHKYNDTRLIVGGAFDKIYKGTSDEETIHRLAEANLSNGGCTLLNSFNFTFNTDENDNGGWVKALGSYKHYLFIGGDFDIINGENRRGLAIIDLNTNQLLNWNPDVGVQFDGATDSNGISVHTLKVDIVNKILHIGGDFITPYRGYIQYNISSLDNNNTSGIQRIDNKSGLDGDVWQINRDTHTEKLYMVGSFTNKFAEIIQNDVTSYNIGFTGTPYAVAIKPGNKLFIGGNNNEFKALTLPNFSIDNTWVPSIGGTIRYERWGNATFRMGYVDEDHIVLGVNGLTTINGTPIVQIGSVDASLGATSSWRQNKIYSGDFFHAFLVTNDWLYLAASIVRFAKFGRIHPAYPQISVNDISKTECTAPQLTNDFNFTVTLSTPAPSEGSTITYSLGNGTATTTNNDYTDQLGTLFFNPGESSRVLSIQVNCDSDIEQNENFNVILSNPLSLTIAKAIGIGTIQNDDSLILPSKYTLGDYVWLDTNKDGIQDNNESGINNITVNLYNNTNCTGAIFSTTTTANGGSPAHNGYYQFNNLDAANYCIEFILPSNHIVSPNTGTNDNTNSDANSTGYIQNINLTSNTSNKDIGIYTSEATVQLGNRVWIENDNDGDATTGVITAIQGLTVTAKSTNGTEYTGLTDSNGNYLISVPRNDTYIVSVETPTNHEPTANSNDNEILDTNSENDLSHDGSGTSVLITTVDNLSVDFGFRATTVLATSQTICQQMQVSDDTSNANETNATTTIDVLNNDVGSKAGQTIKILANSEGQTLWEQQSTLITSVTTLDSLTIPNEGTWSVENDKIVFTALNSFDGQIPTPIYYIVEGSSCTPNTKYTNVGKITIDTACHCPSYTTKSVSSVNLMGLLIFTLLVLALTYSFTKEKTLVK